MLTALIAKSAEIGWKLVLETILDVRTEINESVKSLILFAEDMGSIYQRCLIGPFNGKSSMSRKMKINMYYLSRKILKRTGKILNYNNLWFRANNGARLILSTSALREKRL